jgi:hypothetical protein
LRRFHRHPSTQSSLSLSPCRLFPWTPQLVVILDLVDSSSEAADLAGRSNLASAISAADKQTETELLIIAKLQVSDPGVDFDTHLAISLSMSKKVDILRAGMWISSFNKLAQAGIDRAAECAPYSRL